MNCGKENLREKDHDCSCAAIAHVGYIKIQLETIDITTRLWGYDKDLYGLHHKAS